MGRSTFETESKQGSFIELALEVQKKIPTLSQKRKKVIVIAGPTSVGKSDLAMQLADKIGGEIVSCDSMQIYRGMNIGTAKPSLEDQLQTPHHMIDLIDVNDSYNVVDYYEEAKQACRVIHERNNIPIVVGGSGFYVHTFIYGPPSGPPPNRVLRTKLEQELESLGADSLYERLKEKDPEYSQTITVHDKHKIIRALEIMEITHEKVSKTPWKQKQRPRTYDFRCWFFNRPRESLYRRINQRAEKMVERGLLEEIKGLIPQGIESNKLVANAIGYKQGLEYLKSTKTPEEYTHFLEEFKKATRHYAKRQITWFKKEPLFNWLDLDLHDPETIIDIILRDYECWQWET